jgi:DNA-3-methyladenine glycosylase II
MAERPRRRQAEPAAPLPAPIVTREALASHLAALHALDPRFADVALAAGEVPMRLIEPGFKGLAWVITGQMISTVACRAIFDRCETALGGFSAECIAGTDDAVLKTAGQSVAKIRTLRAVSAAILAARWPWTASRRWRPRPPSRIWPP